MQEKSKQEKYGVQFMADDPENINSKTNKMTNNPKEENGTNSTEIAVNQPKNLPLSVVDMSQGDLPDLSDAVEVPLDLMSNYWTPTSPNETKRVFFDCIKTRMVLDQQTGEALDLPCAFFFEKVADGTIKTISNGSKRLVGIFESGSIPRGTPVQITYLGKKKNATNGFSSDSWSVYPLQIKGKQDGK